MTGRRSLMTSWRKRCRTWSSSVPGPKEPAGELEEAMQRLVPECSSLMTSWTKRCRAWPRSVPGPEEPNDELEEAMQELVQ